MMVRIFICLAVLGSADREDAYLGVDDDDEETMDVFYQDGAEMNQSGGWLFGGADVPRKDHCMEVVSSQGKRGPDYIGQNGTLLEYDASDALAWKIRFEDGVELWFRWNDAIKCDAEVEAVPCPSKLDNFVDDDQPEDIRPFGFIQSSVDTATEVVKKAGTIAKAKLVAAVQKLTTFAQYAYEEVTLFGRMAWENRHMLNMCEPENRDAVSVFVASSVSQMISYTGMLAAMVTTPVLDALLSGADAVKQFGVDVLNQVGELASTASENGKSAMNRKLLEIKQLFEEVKAQALEAHPEIGIVQEKLISLGQKIGEVSAQVIEDVHDRADEIGAKIDEFKKTEIGQKLGEAGHHAGEAGRALGEAAAIAGSHVGKKIGGLASQVGDKVSAHIALGREHVERLLQSIQTSVVQLAQVAASKVQGGKEALMNFAKATKSKIMDISKRVFNRVLDCDDKVKDAVTSQITMVLGLVRTKAGQLIQAVLDGAESVRLFVGNLAEDAKLKINIFTNHVKAMYDYLLSLPGKAMDQLEQMRSQLLGHLAALAKQANALIKALGDRAHEMGGEIVRVLDGLMQSAADAMGMERHFGRVDDEGQDARLRSQCLIDYYMYAIDGDANMEGEKRSNEDTVEGCQQRCKNMAGCAYFSYWPNGGCHVQTKEAKLYLTMNHVIAGHAECS